MPNTEIKYFRELFERYPNAKISATVETADAVIEVEINSPDRYVVKPKNILWRETLRRFLAGLK